MTEYIVGHILKAITYHYLLLKNCACGTIRGCTTIKINHKNKFICTRIVTHGATIQICTTNQVNTVLVVVTFFDGMHNDSYFSCNWLPNSLPRVLIHYFALIILCTILRLEDKCPKNFYLLTQIYTNKIDAYVNSLPTKY